MARRWNAKVLVESDRGTTINNFKSWGEDRRLTTEPNLAWDASLQGSTGRQFGISMGAGSSNRRLAAIGYLYEWLYTVRSVDADGRKIYNFHYIYDIGLLREIKKWNVKGNFDRISAMLVGMYDVKEFYYNKVEVKKPQTRKGANSTGIFNRPWYS